MKHLQMKPKVIKTIYKKPFKCPKCNEPCILEVSEDQESKRAVIDIATEEDYFSDN